MILEPTISRTPRAFLSFAAAAAGMILVVSMTGVIASPDSLNGVDREKQKRTMAAMRSIGAAMEAYSVDNNVYPVAASILSLRPLLEPRYINPLPMTDGWGWSFSISSVPSAYTLLSLGKDGTIISCAPARTTDFRDDICMVNGGFTRYPAGPQQ
ncbi:MAG TPA: type II secretion system protein GspG [Candidatus Polarisedimenticolaceae bacterium]|nr:type II secretion system protein GspG [Candidatus Polarisedimenticolaceae bacterium]